MSELQILLSVLGLPVAIEGVLRIFSKSLFAPFWRWVTDKVHEVPKATIRAVPAQDEGGIGHDRSGRVTLGLSWHLTNTSDRPVSVVDVVLKVKPAIRGFILLAEREDDTEYPLPPHEAVSADTRFYMPTERANTYGEAVVADVVFIDQYGNEHKVKRQRFKRRYRA